MNRRKKVVVQEEEIEEVEWTEWHPSMQGSTNVTLVVGPRGSGKTTFTTAVMRYKRYLQRGYVLCLTPEAWNTWTNYFPASYIYQVFGPEFEKKEKEINEVQEGIHMAIKAEGRSVERLGEAKAKEVELVDWAKIRTNFVVRAEKEKWSMEQTKTNYAIIEKQWKEELKQRSASRFQEYNKAYEARKLPHVILSPFDDLGFDKKAMRSHTINLACQNGRHYLKELYYLCQHFMQFSSDNRDAVDWLMVAPNVSTANVDRLCKQYMPGGVTKNVLVPILDQFARNRWWLCIDRRSKSRNPRDFIFRYQVEHQIVTDTYMGDDLYQYVHRMCFDPERVAEERSRARRYYEELMGGEPADQDSKSEGATAKKKQSSDAKKDLTLLYSDFGPEREAKLMKKYLQKEMSKKNSAPINLLEFA